MRYFVINLRYLWVATRFALFNIILCVLLFFSFLNAHADSLFPSKAIYFGANMGGGSTEWKYLVDTTDAYQSGSTPISVSEGGPSWGVVFGYALNKNFAIEAQYMQFANSDIEFGSSSQYQDQHGNPVLGIISETVAYSLSGKFLAQIGHTHFRAFAAIGIGTVERKDPLVNYQYNADTGTSNYTGNSHSISCVTPYLSSGLVYSFTRHWMLESGFQYYTGFGKSEVYPAASFIPFAWDAYGRLAYQL